MFLPHQRITFSHFVVIGIVDINTGVIFKPHFQCTKNFKFKAIHSRRLCKTRMQRFPR